ncbi:response regulator [Leptolyngbya sp. PCC 6406]|uniref:response regulator n=1 Tax=Leptolyngbya sp. PCC 6406 TaxID=1173264 RepID=UPI0002ABDB2C|nr:response regulator [Leptolyngbya sp. PCC 6406]
MASSPPRSLTTLFDKLPLRIVLVVSFVVQVAAAVGLTAVLSLRNGQKAVNDLAEQLSNNSTARIQEHLNSYLIQPNLLQRNSRSILFNGDLTVSDFEALHRHFWHQLRASDGITSIYLGRETGEFIGVQERVDGRTVLWEVTLDSLPERITYQLNDQGLRGATIATQPYDPRTRPWYQAVVRNGHASWSPIYEFASQDYSVLGITLASPITGDGGELAGVIALDLTLEQISSYLRLLNISAHGEAFILERSGEIVATSVQEAPFVTLPSGKLGRLQATASENPSIRATAQHLLGQFGTLEQIQSVQQIAFRRDGERQLVHIVPFRDGRGLDWLIITIIPEADFMGQITAYTRTTLILCGISLIVASLIAALTARWVVQPILRLNSAAKELALGHWDQPIPSGRFEELSELAIAFQTMAQQLKKSFYDLQASNQELQRLDKLKDEFLANTSHELKTPLNGIIGLAESLIDGASGPLPRRTKGNLAMIVASGRRLSNLVNDILDFSQLRHNRIQLKVQTVGVREATELVLGLTQSLAHQKNLQLINAVSPQLPPVLADENRLQQILYNLLGNALKFTDYGMIGVSAQIMRSQHGTVQPLSPAMAQTRERDAEAPPAAMEPGKTETTVVKDRLERAIARKPRISFVPQAGDQLAITVSDTGIGIPADQLERIFEPFEQADGSTSRIYGGLGIGLAVTKQLVELHGGTIQVISAIGAGSQFTFTLPLAHLESAPALQDDLPSTATLPTVKMAEQVAALNREALTLVEPFGSDDGDSNNGDSDAIDARQFLILVVDDEPVNRQVIVNHLSVHSYRVTQASNGPEALAMLSNGLLPDLILLDVMMPRMTGYEVCRQVREQHPAYALPIVMLTAKNQVADLVEGLSAGANDYLTKPVSKGELLARLNTHLRLSKINLAYSRFVPREFLQFLNKESIVDVELGDQVEQHMSVLFADIRDFTSLSEQMSPEENFRFINAFLSRMEPTIAEHYGFIDKYIGDAIMALFSRGADDALRASIAMLQRLHDYNMERATRQRAPIAIGVGINTGHLMLGTVGGRNRMDGTVISDTVNVAARIERMTRAYSVNLLISHHTFMELENPNGYALRVIDRVQMKGKTLFVSVYEVYEADPPTLRVLKSATKTLFESALLLYFQGAYSNAAERFQRCLDQCPEDKVAAIYHQRCQNHLLRG